MLQNIRVWTPDSSDSQDKPDSLSGKYILLQEHIDREIQKAVKDRIPLAVQPRDTGKHNIPIRFWDFVIEGILRPVMINELERGKQGKYPAIVVTSCAK